MIVRKPVDRSRRGKEINCFLWKLKRGWRNFNCFPWKLILGEELERCNTRKESIAVQDTDGSTEKPKKKKKRLQL